MNRANDKQMFMIHSTFNMVVTYLTLHNTYIHRFLCGSHSDSKMTPKVLYMSFDRFLLVVESRDLSQADKSIIRVSSFQFYKTSIFEWQNLQLYQNKLFGTWQN